MIGVRQRAAQNRGPARCRSGGIRAPGDLRRLLASGITQQPESGQASSAGSFDDRADGLLEFSDVRRGAASAARRPHCREGEVRFAREPGDRIAVEDRVGNGGDQFVLEPGQPLDARVFTRPMSSR